MCAVIRSGVIFAFIALSVTRTIGEPVPSTLESKENVCQLMSDKVTINCSNKGLHSIPRDFTFKCKNERCLTIDLSGNHIQEVHDYAFERLPYIKSVILTGNEIAYISSKAFTGLRNVEALMLDDNRIQYHELKPATFRTVSSLKELFLENQNPGKTQEGYPVPILSCLSNLTYLSIDFVCNGTVSRDLENDKVKKFDEEFEAMRSLERLIMFPPKTSKNYLVVPENTFLHVNKIRVLSMRSCRLSVVEEMALSYFTRLRSLDLGQNDQLGLKPAIDLLRHLNSPLTHLDLEHVEHFLRPVKLTQNETRVFAHLPIENISLVEDHIAYIEGENIGKYLRHLRTIYIGQNNLVAGGDIHNLAKLQVNVMRMENLTMADISYWKLGRDDSDMSSAEYKSSFKPVRIDGNTFLGITSQGKPISRRGTDTFHRKKVVTNGETHNIISLPKNLERVSIQGTFRPGDFIYYLHCHKNKLKYLDASHTNFKLWPIHGPTYPCLNALHTLDMGYNDFAKIIADRWRAFPSLKKLLLPGNRLYVMLRDKKTKHFNHLNSLEHLDLGDNNLVAELYPEMFSELPVIKEIVLRRNRLFTVTHFMQKSVEFIDFSQNFIEDPYLNVSGMPLLKQVNFANNNIRFVSEDALKLWHGKNISLDFSQNPFKCSSCQFLPFLEWFNYASSEPRTVTLLNGDKYLCHGGVYVREVNLKRLNDKCKKLTWRIISITVTIGVALFITFGGILYRYRWTIKFWIVFAARRSRGYPTDRRRKFRFDAFVIYSSEERCWVHDVLRTRLEDGSDFGLCIHYRNFLPGHPIEENILDAIENSRHCMLIVSRNFLKSEWCIFEMHMARNVFRQQRKDVLILVLLEDIPVQDAPLTLVNLLRTRTYLKWPADDAVGQEAFWEVLKETLRQEPEIID